MPTYAILEPILEVPRQVIVLTNERRPAATVIAPGLTLTLED